MSDTVKVRWSISLGLVGCTKTGVEEYDREEWESMTADQQEEEMQEIVSQEMEWGYGVEE